MQETLLVPQITEYTTSRWRYTTLITENGLQKRVVTESQVMKIGNSHLVDFLSKLGNSFIIGGVLGHSLLRLEAVRDPLKLSSVQPETIEVRSKSPALMEFGRVGLDITSPILDQIKKIAYNTEDPLFGDVDERYLRPIVMLRGFQLLLGITDQPAFDIEEVIMGAYMTRDLLGHQALQDEVDEIFYDEQNYLRLCKLQGAVI